MDGPVVHPDRRTGAPRRPAALHWLYALTFCAFVVVGGTLARTNRTLHVQSLALQEQARSLGEQQVLAAELRSMVREYRYGTTDGAGLSGRCSDTVARYHAAMARLETFAAMPALQRIYAGGMARNLAEVSAAWAEVRPLLTRASTADPSAVEAGGEVLCGRLCVAGAALLEVTRGALHLNQVRQARMMYGYAGSMVLLAAVMLWALWLASRNRSAILGLNTVLEQRVAERTVELEKANLYLSNVQSSICSSLIVTDSDNRIMSLNPAAEQLCCMTQEQARGREVFELLPFDEGDDFRRAVASARRTGRVALVRERPFADRRGSRGYASAALVPMVAPPAVLRGVVILIDDVTEMVRARQELALRAAEIDKANTTLRRVNQDLEQFVYAASHDLRAPLANLHGLIQKIERSLGQVRSGLPAATVDDGSGLDGVLDHDIPKALTRMKRSIAKSGSLIDGLLRYSRTGRTDYRRVHVDMNRESARVVELFAATIESKDVHLYIDNLPAAHGDVEAVNTVLTNLIENALNYLSPDRPGEIVVEGRASEAGFNCYCIRDNGSGIREAHLDRIFNMFERADRTSGSGEGLGLAIVKKIIERHGGEIRVESTWGRGSTFWFTLPAAPRATAPADSGERTAAA